MCRAWFAFALLLGSVPAAAQQVADSSYVSTVEHPAFAPDEGPLVLIDGAHHNFHTVDGRYLAFAMLLRADGYRVAGVDTPFTPEALAGARLLVISNALHASNTEDWYLPTPSAFTAEEVSVVHAWVRNGGSLFLIADHMPFPGAAETLAGAFGIAFQNGFALVPETGDGTIRFVSGEGTLGAHAILSGRNPGEQVPFVVSFTGQAFRARRDVTPLLVIPEGMTLLLPEVAWEFSERTPRLPAGGLFQGVVFTEGKGRVAVFGEAAMFTAQRSGNNRFGMSDPQAPHNRQFALNLVHWLTGVLD